MSDSFYDTVVMIFFIVIPVVLIALHIFLSKRKKMMLGFIVPTLWTLLGVIMVVKAVSFPLEVGIFFGAGLLILLGIFIFIKKRKKSR